MVFDTSRKDLQLLRRCCLSMVHHAFPKAKEMTPLLPREMLWTDLNEIYQFYELDPVNEEFAEVLKIMPKKFLGCATDRVKVFNELYYQITRMVYERPAPRELVYYEKDIRGDMGSKQSVDLIMSMLYFLTSLIENNEQRLNRFVLITIKERYERCFYWEPLKKCYNKVRRTMSLTYDFKPHPVTPDQLAGSYVKWQEITNNYDNGAIIEIISLWGNEDARRVVFEMIKSSINFNTPKVQKAYYNQVNSILKSGLFGEPPKQTGDSELEARIAQLDSKVMMLERENAVFQNLTKELQADNATLRTLLAENKVSGEARKFTLVEIVNYGKNCMSSEAMAIVHMLNKLLRKIGTDEDYNLVDDIEKELNNRKSGDTVIGNKNIFDGSSQQIAVQSKEPLDLETILNKLAPELRNQVKKALEDNG